MKPVVLITGGTGAAANGTPTYNVNMNYAEVIRKAGGVPILAIDPTLASEYADMADALLLSGGKDVETKYYGQEQMFDFIMTDPERDVLEFAMIEEFVKRKKPNFGICRGFQILNVYFGGTLWQDIPAQLGGEHSKGVVHPLKIKKDSILGSLMGVEEMEVNSYHHQAAAELGKGLIATGWADAGGHEIVECFQHESLPIWATQWHPERMQGEVTNPPVCKDSMPIFEDFVKKCMK